MALRHLMDDATLYAAHQAGDPDAFGALWRRHQAPVLGYATRMLGAAEEAEDLVHEAMLRAATGRWTPSGSFRGWLLTVVHRMCLDTLRRRQRWSLLPRWLVREEPPAVDAALMHDQAQAGLERALAQLPEEHRAALLLYYGQELPSKEVAEILGWEDHQVRSRLSYARKRLRELLEA